MIKLPGISIERQIPKAVEQFAADMHRRYVNAHYDVRPESRTVNGRCRTTMLFGGIRLDHFQSCPEADLQAAASDVFELGLTLRGHARSQRILAGHASTREGSAHLVTPGRKFHLRTAEGAQVIALTFAPDKVQKAARSILGDAFDLRDASVVDMGRPETQALLRNATLAFKELIELDKVGLSALASVSCEELLLNLAVGAIAPALQLQNAEERLHAPTLVTRAEEIMSAHAHKPLTIADVADACQVTVRTLQLAFRKHRGMTPLQFLINRRLMMARDLLLSPERSSNVQSVAMDCGFLSVGKFAQRYRAMFGELPSATLSRQRR